MKKFLIFVLILAMVPMIALAEEQDPIVGSWYLYYDLSALPEMASLFPGYTSMFSIYTFQSDGVIMLTENDVRSASDSDLLYNPTGKWSKTDDQYSYSMIGVGEGNCHIENDDLLISLQSGVDMRFHRLLPFNPYKDYVFNR